jgi:hypothetical protein
MPREYVNRWNIPDWLAKEVKNRDDRCVYCGSSFNPSTLSGDLRASVATWEHIINDATIITRENIALCCAGCNASKGARRLFDWMQSKYCKERAISRESVATVVRAALDAGL